MEHPDPAVRDRATVDWCAWEDAVLSGETGGASHPYGDRPAAARLAFVRICAHFFSHGARLDDGALLRDATVIEAAGHLGTAGTRQHVLRALDRFAVDDAPAGRPGD
jgi:proline iminopeptidase